MPNALLCVLAGLSLLIGASACGDTTPSPPKAGPPGGAADVPDPKPQGVVVDASDAVGTDGLVKVGAQIDTTNVATLALAWGDGSVDELDVDSSLHSFLSTSRRPSDAFTITADGAISAEHVYRTTGRFEIALTACSTPDACKRVSLGTATLDCPSTEVGSCDDDLTNGCETDLTSAANCGECGNACDQTVGVCDEADICEAFECQARQKALGTICRASAGDCDVPEKCTGASAQCPPDEFKSEEVICRDSVGQCDIADTCDGGSASCPADNFAAATTPCDDETECTVPDRCDGNGACVGVPQVGVACLGDVPDAIGLCNADGVCELVELPTQDQILHLESGEDAGAPLNPLLRDVGGPVVTPLARWENRAFSNGEHDAVQALERYQPRLLTGAGDAASVVDFSWECESGCSYMVLDGLPGELRGLAVPLISFVYRVRADAGAGSENLILSALDSDGSPLFQLGLGEDLYLAWGVAPRVSEQILASSTRRPRLRIGTC